MGGRGRGKIDGKGEGKELQANSVRKRWTPTNSGALKNELQTQTYGALPCHNAANPVGPCTGVSETGLHQTETFVDHLCVFIVQKLKDLMSEPQLSGDRCIEHQKTTLTLHVLQCTNPSAYCVLGVLLRIRKGLYALRSSYRISFM